MSDAAVGSILARSLDALDLRYRVIAQNVANAGSESYRPMRLDFEQQLRRAADIGDQAVMALRLMLEVDPSFSAGSDMRLDLQLVDAAQTSMRYAALLDITARRMAIARATIGGGQ
jgi:flagellar basal-body rod protein FlgB